MILPDYRATIDVRLQDTRRRLGSADVQRFAQVYLAHHFRLPASKMHRKIFKLLPGVDGKRSRRIAIAAPRGHAKSTVVSLAYVLWCALYGTEQHIVLISATQEQAEQLLRNVRNELQANPLLIEDFPKLCYPPGARPAPKPWRGNQIVLRNRVCIRALGAGQQIRGVKHNEYRPTLLILDDVESPEGAVSGEQRDKMVDWFEKTLLKAGDTQSNVTVVGTILHYDSLLAGLIDSRSQRSRGWTARKYQAVESFSDSPKRWEQWEAIFAGRSEHEGKSGEAAANAFFEANREPMLKGTRVLWPELEDYHQLMLMRMTEGRLSFASEKQNDPIDPASHLFRENEMRFWDDEYDDVATLKEAIGSRARIYGACDPSLGKKGRKGDYSAIVSVLKDTKSGVLYVIDADLDRRSPDETIERIIALARSNGYHEFVVEDNQFQTVMADNLDQRIRNAGVRLRPKRVTHSSDKVVRIQSIEPLIIQGQIRFCRNHKRLLEQLWQFPMGAHDDGPDALEMVVARASAKQMANHSERVI